MDDINPTNFAQEARSESSAGRFNNYAGGNETARGLLNQPDNFTEGLGRGADPMQAAIRSKYNANYSRAQEHLNLNMLKNANADHLKKLEVATQLAGQEHEMNMQKELMRKKRAQASQMMRGQIIGSVLGIAGGVGGAALGGAPGAMAGYQIGSGTGQAMGGGM